MDKIYNKTLINVGSVGNSFDVIRNRNKDSNVLETTDIEIEDKTYIQSCK